ncbi:MAG: PAS domain-containing protein [Phycisphaerae bacterium]|nr:PAS domain-containing protein [Phycisphaerae bacterium]
MRAERDSSQEPDALRRDAEQALRKTRQDVATMPAEDVQKLVHELQVHQIELEMQNQQLRATQQELETSRDAYADLYDFAPVGYVTLDADGAILEANLTAARMLGVQRNELISRKLSSFVDPSDQDTLHRHRREAFSTETRRTCGVQIRTPSEAPRHIRLESIGVPREDGTPNRCRTALIDISERVLVEEALGRARDDLEKRVQERTAELRRAYDRLRVLTSELSLAEEHQRRRLAVQLHDGLDQDLSLAEMKVREVLKSPLAAPLDAPLREIEQLVDRASRQARSVTFQLSPPILYDIGLSAAVHWLTEQIHRQHYLDIAVEDEARITSIRLEPRILLFQAIRELLINVVRHAKATEVEVRMRLVDDDLWIAVADNGCGFDRANVSPGGSGLGLLGIRERLSALEGRVDVDSAPGRGARITIAVPLRNVIGDTP